MTAPVPAGFFFLFHNLPTLISHSSSHDVVLRVRQAVHDDGQDLRGGPRRSGTAGSIPEENTTRPPAQRTTAADEGTPVGRRAGKH